MSFEAYFLLGYAVALLLVALGLDRLGRVSPSPWSSRVLAGHRRRHPDVRGEPGWPHSEQPRLHTGMALVAAAAATVIVAAGLLRHHAGLPGVLLAVTGVAAGGVLARLGSGLGRRGLGRQGLRRPGRG